MARIVIYVPGYGHQISAATFQATHRLVPALHAKGHEVAISTSSSPDIAEVRNVALTHWFDGMKAATHLLMIDSDMGFPPDVVLDMLGLNEPMVGVIYPKKLLEVEWAASGWGEHTNAGGKGHFMKVRGLGMGCFLIRRDAIQTMIEKMPEIIDPETPGPDQLHPEARLIRAFDPMRNAEGRRMSEDISFCYRWELCGGEVWGAGGYEIEHVGMHSYKACYAKWAEEKAQAKLAQAAE